MTIKEVIVDFVQLATNFGIGVACLAALALAVWRALIWLGTYIALPVAQRHIKFIDDLTVAMTSQSQAMQTMSVQQGKNLEGIGSLTEAMQKILTKQEELLELVMVMQERLQSTQHVYDVANEANKGR